MGTGVAVPRIESGRRFPFRAVISAPMRSSGRTTRFMGREESDGSPEKYVVRHWVATTPIRSLVPVPEFPRSRIDSGSHSPPTPQPRTIRLSGSGARISAPRCRRASSVRATSSPWDIPEIIVSPTASVPKIRARCDTDLSPGTQMCRSAVGRDVR